MGVGGGLEVAPAVGAVTLPAGHVVPPNCKVEFEEIETQECTPRANRVCDTKELKHEGVEYKQVCKDVVSKHCGVGPAVPHLLAAAHPVPAAATVTTIKHECQEVTSKHCVDTPEKVSTTVPVERCHVERVVDCKPV